MKTIIIDSSSSLDFSGLFYRFNWEKSYFLGKSFGTRENNRKYFHSINRLFDKVFSRATERPRKPDFCSFWNLE